MSTEIDQPKLTTAADALEAALWHVQQVRPEQANYGAADALVKAQAAIMALRARIQPAPALTAAELVRSTYPPSATAQRAKELLWADTGAMEWARTQQWVRDVRDFLRDLAKETT